jgi:hypothetical protein
LKIIRFAKTSLKPGRTVYSWKVKDHQAGGADMYE